MIRDAPPPSARTPSALTVLRACNEKPSSETEKLGDAHDARLTA
jgi:hypothetical protein